MAKGWSRESKRHSLAARGVKTGSHQKMSMKTFSRPAALRSDWNDSIRSEGVVPRYMWVRKEKYAEEIEYSVLSTHSPWSNMLNNHLTLRVRTESHDPKEKVATRSEQKAAEKTVFNFAKKLSSAYGSEFFMSQKKAFAALEVDKRKELSENR